MKLRGCLAVLAIATVLAGCRSVNYGPLQSRSLGSDLSVKNASWVKTTSANGTNIIEALEVIGGGSDETKGAKIVTDILAAAAAGLLTSGASLPVSAGSALGAGTVADIVQQIIKPAATTPTAPPAVKAGSTCACDLSAPKIEPTRGPECPVPYGRDVRFLAWSPESSDWVFIPTPSTYVDFGNTHQVGAACDPAAGLHLLGMRVRSSSSALIPAVDGKVQSPYQETTRFYFEQRQGK